MEGKEEPSATFNINLLTGNLTVPAVLPASANVPVLVQTPQSSQMLPPPTPDVPSSSKAGGGKAKPPGKVKAKESLEKTSDEYIRRRQRNNVAVKKSREKTREKSAYTLQKVEQLKAENEQLESKIAILTKELSVLKDLFMDHARGLCADGNSNLPSPEILESLLGCKLKRIGGSTSVAGTSTATSSDSAQSHSTIEPLINVAEIELMSFKNDNIVTESTEVNTDNVEHVVSLGNDVQGSSHINNGS